MYEFHGVKKIIPAAAVVLGLASGCSSVMPTVETTVTVTAVPSQPDSYPTPNFNPTPALPIIGPSVAHSTASLKPSQKAESVNGTSEATVRFNVCDINPAVADTYPAQSSFFAVGFRTKEQGDCLTVTGKPTELLGKLFLQSYNHSTSAVPLSPGTSENMATPLSTYTAEIAGKELKVIDPSNAVKGTLFCVGGTLARASGNTMQGLGKDTVCDNGTITPTSLLHDLTGGNITLPFFSGVASITGHEAATVNFAA